MKKLLSIFLMLFVIIISLTSCGKDVTKIRTVLEKINDNSFNSNGVSLSYDQKYDVKSSIDNEEEKITNTINYEANGSLDLVLDNDYYYDFSEVFTKSNCYISSLQHEKYYSEENELDKSSNDKRVERVNRINDFDVKLKFDEENYIVKCNTNFLDENDSNNDSKETLNGKIKKELLVDSISSNSITEIISLLIFTDGQALNLAIEIYIQGLLSSCKNFNDEEYSKFINDNDINVKENEASTIIELNVDYSKVFDNSLGIETNGSIIINSKFEFENTNFKLTNFEFDLSNYLAAILKIKDTEEEDRDLKITVHNYNVNGKLIYNKAQDYKLEGDFTEYTDSDSFINDVRNIIFPYQS